MWQQWDLVCGGGIYWSRDRNGKKAGYKSTITNVQHIQLGARLYLLTKNQTQLKIARDIYEWMTSKGVITKDGEVYDGMDADNNCSHSQVHNSYIYGSF
jgi:mannan endo-1,6-alpha-mannosidase